MIVLHRIIQVCHRLCAHEMKGLEICFGNISRCCGRMTDVTSVTVGSSHWLTETTINKRCVC